MRACCLIASFVVLLGCSSDPSCEDDKNCNPASGGSGGNGADGGTGATGGTGGTGGDGGGCDTSKSPSEEACLVSDDQAIFVSPTGSDGASGTKADPLKTITEAATVAGGSKIVVACNGTYDEHVSITAGAKVYGGFDCTSWAYESGTKPSVAPTTAGYALEIDAGSDLVVVEDVEFVASAGTAPAPSSIAAFVNSSANVTLARVKLEAGTGAKGANGALVPYTFPKTQAELKGNDAVGIAGGAPKQCDCPAGDNSIGGAGGDAPPATNGNPGQPPLGGGQGGTAGSPTDCGSGGTGKNGNVGTTPANGTGAASSGTFSSSGWSPAEGAPGAGGVAGQGGGGGASSASGGGGGGGCGGCGGAGGPGGKGGGASIALLALSSPVVLTDSELIAKDAGDGGAGSDGQPGQTDIGGGGIQGTLACAGGAGATGGKGSAGGGGAGGISAAIAYKGAKPTGGSLMAGALGSKGIGGKPGINDGVDGSAENELLLP